jgi:hypothetical protein
MSTTTQTAQPDLAAVKARQQKLWASGSYAAVAARTVPMAEHLAQGPACGPATASWTWPPAAATPPWPRPNWSASAAPAAPSAWSTGPRRASSATCSRPSPGTCRPGRGAATQPVGTEERLRELLGDAVSSLEITRRTYVWRFRSPEEFAGFFQELYGPTRKALEALDEDGRQRLWDDLTALARDHDTEQGLTVAMPAEYLEVRAQS